MSTSPSILMKFKNTSGLLSSPYDPRDYPLSGAMPDIKRYPEEYPRPFDLTITNQLNTPKCVAHAGSVIKQYMELKERNFIEPDYDWLYAQCKSIDGIPNVAGTYFRAVLQVLHKTGCKLKGQNNDPSIYRIGEYRQIDDLSFEGLKKTVAVYGHALVGFRGSNEGWRSEVVRPPKAGETLWSHAVALTHYEKNYLGYQNSWGSDKHRDGLFKADKNYLPYEGWVITVDIPNIVVLRGWVAGTYVSNNKTTANLNVREQPTTSAKILRTLAKGTTVRPTNTPSRVANGHTWIEIEL